MVHLFLHTKLHNHSGKKNNHHVFNFAHGFCRSGTVGMACLYSMRAGSRLEDPDGSRCLEIGVWLEEGWER